MPIVVAVNDVNFIREVQNSDKPVLLDFFATWCGPCQMLAPTIEEVAQELEGQVRVCKTDVDQAPGLVQQFRIMSVPTLIIFHQGSEVCRLVGGQSKEQILQVLEQVL